MKIQKNIFTFALIWLLPQLLMIFNPGWGEALAGVSSFRDCYFMDKQTNTKKPIGATWKKEKRKGVFYLYQRFADGDRPIKRLSPYKLEQRKNYKYRPDYTPPVIIPEKIDFQEFWVNVEGFPNYQISNYGDVRSYKKSLKKWVILKQWKVTNGYMHVSLRNNKKLVQFGAHRLCLLNFSNKDKNIATTLTVGHADNDKTNNMGGNLYWCTQKENNLKAWSDGLCKNTGFKPGCKAHQLNKNPVIQFDCQDKEIAEYSCASEVQSKLKIDASSVLKCCKGKRYLAGGFKWRYKQ